MVEFLKTFGYGFLYFIGLPFILVGFLIYGIYLLILFLFLSFKGIILYFKGSKLDLSVPEDKIADEIINKRINISMNQDISIPQNQGVTYNTINQFNINEKSELRNALHELNKINGINDDPLILQNKNSEDDLNGNS